MISKVARNNSWAIIQHILDWLCFFFPPKLQISHSTVSFQHSPPSFLPSLLPPQGRAHNLAVFLDSPFAFLLARWCFSVSSFRGAHEDRMCLSTAIPNFLIWHSSVSPGTSRGLVKFTFIHFNLKKKYRWFCSFKRGKWGVTQPAGRWILTQAISLLGKIALFQASLGRLSELKCFANVWENFTFEGGKKNKL